MMTMSMMMMLMVSMMTWSNGWTRKVLLTMMTKLMMMIMIMVKPGQKGEPGRCFPPEQLWRPPHWLHPSSLPQQPPFDNIEKAIWHPENYVFATFYILTKVKWCFWNTLYPEHNVFLWHLHPRKNIGTCYILKEVFLWHYHLKSDVFGILYTLKVNFLMTFAHRI